MINQLLGWQDFQLDQNLHTFSLFLFADYCTDQFCRHESSCQKSYILLYYLFRESSKYSTILSVHWNFFLFFISFCFSPISFFLFAWRFHNVLAFHQSFQVFSRYVVCYFLLLIPMRTFEKITLASQAISLWVFIWGEKIDSPPRQYIDYQIYRFFKAIFGLGDI